MIRRIAVGNDHITAAVHTDFRRLQFGNHAPGALLAAADPGQSPKRIVQGGHGGNQHGGGILAGVGGIQAVDIRQQHQQRRPHAFGHNGSQGVVVADDNLLGGHGVVFIDDGQGPQVQQPVQGVAEIPVALFAGHILPGNQQLGHGMVVIPEELIINVHQLTLAHGSSGLLPGDIPGALAQAQLPHPHADGPGGYQNHLMPRIFNVADHLTQGGNPADIQVPCGMGQGACTDFYHNTHWVPS